MAETAARRAETDEADDLGLGGYVPRTELGRLALAARREFLAANGRFLTEEEFEREKAERRGGVELLEFDER